ncbi:MAG TPA: IS1595 family transposase [Burkholderiales bacterium]
MDTKTKVQNTSTKNDKVIADLPVACADEKAAVEFMEKQRWGDHPACPHCGDLDVYQMKDSKTGARQANFRWRCHGCKDQFTVKVGTVLEDSRIPLRHWCYGFWRASTSKKGVSALEIKRQTGLSYKSALFMLQRIRFAMEDTPSGKLHGDVEVDEVYIGGRPRYKGVSKRGRGTSKTPVLAMVERSGGHVRTQVLPNITGKTLRKAVMEQVDQASRIHTDELGGYVGIGKYFDGGHVTVRHAAGEYAKGDITTNRVESFFAIVRRGIDGIYHSVSKEHLHRYLAEFSFRYSNRDLADGQRTQLAIKMAQGKRLMYRTPIGK